MAETRVGYWYATGPADKQYTPGDPDFNLHTVVSDTSQFAAHVTVEPAGKQRFPVPCSLIDEIATPQGQITLPANPRFTSEWRHNACQPHEGTRVSTGPCNEAIDARSIFLHDPHSNARHS